MLKISLLGEHDAHKLIKGDLLVTVEISHCDHLADVLFREVALEHLRNICELPCAKCPLVYSENKECLKKLVLCLRVLQFRRHESKEFIVVNLTVHVLVNVANDVIQLVLCWIESQHVHDHLELVMLYAT